MAYTTIDKPTDYFNTKLYTGNGSTQSITGVGFQPDWVWTKNRDNGAEWHTLYDSVRGVYKRLYTNVTNGEESTTQSLTSFDSDGFSLGAYSGSNGNGENIVSWNWLASNTTASNTDGSITSTVSANTTSGFSIVSYTGSGSVTSFGHGLGVAPSMVIIKNRDDTDNWTVFHLGINSGQGYIYLNSNALAVTGSSRRYRYGDDSDGKLPDSSKVYLGTASDVNQSGEDYIAYCFAEKKGFSKFGSYTGNGSTDGTFVYTGFKPAFVMFKNTETTANWGMIDNKRDDDNVVKARLFPNLSDTESSSFDICDFTAQGFKLRTTDSQFNSSHKIIYMSFSESPFVTSSGIPTTAR